MSRHHRPRIRFRRTFPSPIAAGCRDELALIVERRHPVARPSD